MTVEPSRPPDSPAQKTGRVAAAAAWSQARALRMSDWATGARDTHASVDVGFRFADRNRRVAAAVLAGGLAYRFFFWFLAAGLVVGGVLGLLDAESIEDAAGDHGLGAAITDTVGDAARASGAATAWLLVIGAWLLLWTGYMGAKTLVLVHATVWGVAPTRLRSALRASLAFTGWAVTYLAAMAAARWLREEASVLGLVVTLGLVAFPFALWLAASSWLPHQAESLWELVPGAVLVAVGVQALNLLTAFFLGPRLTSATELYGGLGIATTVLFWLYIVGRLVVGAATLNVSFVERRRSRVSSA